MRDSRRSFVLAVVPLLFLLASPSGAAVLERPPEEHAILGLSAMVLPDPGILPAAERDPDVTAPEECLGFPVGARPATPEEITRCFETWAEESPRAVRAEHGTTWQGRPLQLLVLSSPENLARLEEIRGGWQRVADPRDVTTSEAERLASELPAIAWMAYSIHGDEVSGADASVALAYHLASARGEAVESTLRDLVVVIDPMMNPDGRARFLHQIADSQGTVPILDDQAIPHAGESPPGRVNHFLFDLNRDWAAATQPETRARIRALQEWYPLLFVDAHEMGSQESYLFYPPTEPINRRVPEAVRKWWKVFGKDQAAAFDRQGWRYYTGEWAEYWYPGYSDSYSTLRGGVGILYEQAGIGQGAIRQASGEILDYGDAVHHQLTSSLANLGTLQRHRTEIARDFLETRRRAVAPSGPFGGRYLAVEAGNPGRIDELEELLSLHGIETRRLERETAVGPARDGLGRDHDRVTLPPDSLIVPGAQPEAHLLWAIVDLDPRMKAEVVERERRGVLGGEGSVSYDVTGWSLPLLYGLTAYEVEGSAPAGTSRAPSASPTPVVDESFTAIVVDGGDDRSVAAAGRLMERGVRVRAGSRPFVFDGKPFARGSIVVTRADNRDRGDLPNVVTEVAAELELEAVSVTTGFGGGDTPDLGGGRFPLLERPRIALLGRGGASSTDLGATWFHLDRKLGIPVSMIGHEAASWIDLRRYNVIVLPAGATSLLDGGLRDRLESWVRAGGTLIAAGSTSGALAREEKGIGSVRVLGSEEDLGPYREALDREWRSRRGRVPDEAWSHRVEPAPEGAPPEDASAQPPEADAEQLMPQGVIAASRVDESHWLTFGADDLLPVLVADPPILLAPPGVAAPVRLGWVPSEGTATLDLVSLGWGSVPAGDPVYLRMSGLMWPEAARRLVNAPYVTVESLGNGQVILFAGTPAFRHMTLGTLRLLANAVVYGPGLGAEPPIVP